MSFAEREEIGLLRAQSVGVREVARRLGRSPSTASRELTRNAATRGGHPEYRASVAVEDGAGCQETEAGETGDQPATAQLCARALGGQGS